MEPKPSNAMRVSTVLVLAVAAGACFVAPRPRGSGPSATSFDRSFTGVTALAQAGRRWPRTRRGGRPRTAPTGGGAAAPYTWALKAPDAKLYDTSCTLVGTHGGGPSWRSEAGGRAVVGAAVASVDAPDTHTAIPWLLLKAVSHTGTGVMSDVIAVQRVDTHGGVAPTSGCDAAHVGIDTSVAYTATYYFYKRRSRDAAGEASDGD